MFSFMVCNILTKWYGVAKHDNKTKASNNYREKEKQFHVYKSDNDAWLTTTIKSLKRVC